MPNNLNSIEVEMLIIAINWVYGYDFYNYARTSFNRRLFAIITKYKLENLGELQHLIVNNADFFKKFLNDITVTTSDFFRDTLVFNAIKREVFPYLASLGNFKVWHAGCAAGEEVYSLAILLQEAQLYSKAIIYATDINSKALEFARNGLFSISRIEQAQKNYVLARGRYAFGNYLTKSKKNAVLDPKLKKNVVFSKHNLVGDQSFGIMQFILCRNVIIYFDKKLQDQVLGLLTDSLCVGGFLCIGIRETLSFSAVEPYFEVVDKKARLYKKIKDRSKNNV